MRREMQRTDGMQRGMAIGLLCTLCASACGRATGPRVIANEQETTLAALVRTHPIGKTTNIRADELTRTPAGSVHVVQVRGGESPHRHLEHDLVVTVVAGEGVLTIDGTRRTLASGDMAVVPRGVPHWFVNTGRDVAVAVVVFMPPLDAPDSVPVDGVDSHVTPR